MRFRIVGVAAAAGCLAGGVSQASAALTAFQTPSRNVGCQAEVTTTRTSVRCDIRARDWKPPAKPSSCPLDYGQGLILGRRGLSRWVCAGDTALGAGAVLPYGRLKAMYGVLCRSETAGLRCWNLDHHGFGLSRQRVTRF